MRKDMLYEALTEKIIGAAHRVYNTLGAGFLESVYHKALLIELRNQGLADESERPITVTYEGESVGDFAADIIVENKVILELKSVKELARVHEVQLVDYLTATGIDVGILINFGESQIQIRRKHRSPLS